MQNLAPGSLQAPQGPSSAAAFHYPPQLPEVGPLKPKTSPHLLVPPSLVSALPLSGPQDPAHPYTVSDTF